MLFEKFRFMTELHVFLVAWLLYYAYLLILYVFRKRLACCKTKFLIANSSPYELAEIYVEKRLITLSWARNPPLYISFRAT